MRDDLLYFSHDTNAQDHPKMQALIAEYGFEGYGRFWALNERIAAASGAAIDISKKVNKLSLGRSLGLNEEGITRFLAFLSDPEIDLVNISPEGILTTDRTQENYQITNKIRERDRDRKQDLQKKKFQAENGKFQAESENLPAQKNAEKTFHPENDEFHQENAVFRPEKTTNRIDRIDRSIKRDREIDDDNRAAGKNPPVENPGPPGAVSSSSLLNEIKAESKAAGFIIPDNLARHLAGSADPSWLTGPHSYQRFAACQIRDQYRNHSPPKAPAELRNLYMAALWNNWKSYREAYPAWREQQAAADAQAAARAETERRKSRPPDHCPNCGGLLQDKHCPACDGIIRFEDGDWRYLPPLPASPAKVFRDTLRQRGEVPRAPPGVTGF
jgi:hypothetical protein